MNCFLGKNFLLTTETARRLFHEVAKQEPIIDYHCHLSSQEIYEDKKFENISEVWLGSDHYKWRLMRANGVPEQFVSGNGDAHQKFLYWASTLEKAIGNPLYSWSHLELKRYFGYEGILNAKTAEEVWQLCNEKIKCMSARRLILDSKVEVLCTTDDPVDSLEWHEKLKADTSFQTRVLPAWRPDRAMAIEKSDYLDYMSQLSEASGMSIDTFEDLKKALSLRLDYFEAHGCRVSDHGLDYVPYVENADDKAYSIFFKKKFNEVLDSQEVHTFYVALLKFLSKEYKRRNWVMQLHFGVSRNNNHRLFERAGADVGGDHIGAKVPLDQLSKFINSLVEEDCLPRLIVYSLNPNDNTIIDTILASFQQEGVASYLQHGAAWWFNDSLNGMTKQMKELAANGLLGNFVGMLTDSRSFLSYARHEYFRRVLCKYIGEVVELGEFPNDEEALSQLIKDISYNNVKRYFGF
ncbi:glucuronate isomerase [Bulleidia sp. zg-1006]|uniref:glucuronate isomerase n=1 Tax=Bulleidia sp. zg-1006 TaxID=2806552 RepID=UPI00193A10C2|nr:glucuronate isomerase [Bulleidia sp. zg-1006]QRG87096.1 glucuronate isomerase [Bulleidia sp. zg-1006]